MSTETQAYIERLDHLRNEAKKVIQGMSSEELNWVPLPADTSSPAVLATHFAGSEGFWVHQVAGGVDVHRDRDAEFAARVSTAAELEALLERTGETTRQTLQRLSGDDLDQSAQGIRGETVTRRYAVLHAIEHLGQHLGHLSLTKQLYAARRQ